MATSKQYAYYLEGNKIAIVEKDVSFDNDVDSKDYGPGASRQRWESPQSDVSLGLEIKYNYSPIFQDTSTGSYGVDFYRFIGWGSDGANLVLFGGQNAFGSVYEYDLSTIFSVGDWINITGSFQFDGLHQVKSISSGNAASRLVLNTPFHLKASKISIGGVTNADVYYGVTDLEDSRLHQFARNAKDKRPYTDTLPLTTGVGDGGGEFHVYIEGGTDVNNYGFLALKVDSTNAGKLLTDTHYRLRMPSQTSSYQTGDGIYDDSDWLDFQIPNNANETADFVIYNAFLDVMQVTKVTALQDESFELDLPLYLQKALVYYIKGKLSEDAGEIKLREYSMREFKKMIEKYENSRISGLRIISPGSHSIR